MEFKLHDKVCMNPSSLRCGITPSSPEGVTGVIVEVQNSDYPYMVMWNGGALNWYAHGDLKLLGHGYSFGKLQFRVGDSIPFKIGRETGYYDMDGNKLHIGDYVNVQGESYSCNCLIVEDKHNGVFGMGWASTAKNEKLRKCAKIVQKYYKFPHKTMDTEKLCMWWVEE